MKRGQIAVLIFTFTLISVGCKKFNSDEGKKSAQKLANGQVWVVRKDRGSGTLERGDCTADLAVEVVPLSGDSTGRVSLSIHKSNSQYSKFEALKNEDRVSFEQVNEPTQKECGDGAFVKIKNNDNSTPANNNSISVTSNSNYNSISVATPATTASVVPSEAPTLTTEEKVNEEANKLAEQFWNKMITKCGDYSYYRRGVGTYEKVYQTKGEANFYVDGQYSPPKDLTEKDRLNRVDAQPIEYDGRIKMSFDLGHPIKGEICIMDACQWKDNYQADTVIKKIKGKWYVDENSPFYKYTPMSCKEIKEIVKTSQNAEKD